MLASVSVHTMVCSSILLLRLLESSLRDWKEEIPIVPFPNGTPGVLPVRSHLPIGQWQTSPQAFPEASKGRQPVTAAT
jgi:hypothetical protein